MKYVRLSWLDAESDKDRTEAARSKGQWAESRFSPEVVSPEGRMIVNATAVA